MIEEEARRLMKPETKHLIIFALAFITISSFTLLFVYYQIFLPRVEPTERLIERLDNFVSFEKSSSLNDTLWSLQEKGFKINMMED